MRRVLSVILALMLFGSLSCSMTVYHQAYDGTTPEDLEFLAGTVVYVDLYTPDGRRGSGSGCMFPDGERVLTASHVAMGTTSFIVSHGEWREFAVLDQMGDADWAVLKLRSPYKRGLSWYPTHRKLQGYSRCWAVGYPLGVTTPTVTEGHIMEAWSGFRRFTAPVAPGSSGGALVVRYRDEYVLAGVVVAVGISANGVHGHMALAVPIEQVRQEMKKLRYRGVVLGLDSWDEFSFGPMSDLGGETLVERSIRMMNELDIPHSVACERPSLLEGLPVREAGYLLSPHIKKGRNPRLFHEMIMPDPEYAGFNGVWVITSPYTPFVLKQDFLEGMTLMGREEVNSVFSVRSERRMHATQWSKNVAKFWHICQRQNNGLWHEPTFGFFMVRGEYLRERKGVVSDLSLVVQQKSPFGMEIRDSYSYEFAKVLLPALRADGYEL